MGFSFKYNENLFKITYKYKVKIISHCGEEYIVSFYDGFICPKCGRKFYFKNKKTGESVNWFNEASEAEICLSNVSWHSVFCNEPLHKYKCVTVVEEYKKYIGKFRTSPISVPFYGYGRKHTTSSYKDRDYSAKGYALKNDICYIEPIYEDDTEESYFVPVVKFRKCNPKTNSGARRSSGWKSNKKKIKQWY